MNSENAAPKRFDTNLKSFLILIAPVCEAIIFQSFQSQQFWIKKSHLPRAYARRADVSLYNIDANIDYAHMEIRALWKKPGFGENAHTSHTAPRVSVFVCDFWNQLAIF